MLTGMTFRQRQILNSTFHCVNLSTTATPDSPCPY